LNIRSLYILIAEDDEDDRLLLTSAFSEINSEYQLVFLDNGIELLNFFTLFEEGKVSRLPSLLILDLNMPRKNGQEALRSLVEKKYFKDFPTVIFSTTGNEAERNRCSEYGIEGFFVKPSKFSELKANVTQFCKLAGSAEPFA
jgi:CheY-like chemotaxis protein